MLKFICMIIEYWTSVIVYTNEKNRNSTRIAGNNKKKTALNNGIWQITRARIANQGKSGAI